MTSPATPLAQPAVPTQGMVADPFPLDGLYVAQYVVPVSAERGARSATAVHVAFSDARCSAEARADILAYITYRMASELPPVAPVLTRLK